MRLHVKLRRQRITRVVFGDETTLHDRFDPRTLTTFEDRFTNGFNRSDFRDAEFLQFLRRIVSFFLEQTFLFSDFLVDRDRAVFVAGLHLVGGILHLAADGGLASLHLTIDELLDIRNFQLAARVLYFVNGRAIRL